MDNARDSDVRSYETFDDWLRAELYPKVGGFELWLEDHRAGGRALRARVRAYEAEAWERWLTERFAQALELGLAPYTRGSRVHLEVSRTYGPGIACAETPEIALRSHRTDDQAQVTCRHCQKVNA